MKRILFVIFGVVGILVALSPVSSANHISIVDNEFTVFGDDYEHNVIDYSDGLVNAVRGEEPSGGKHHPPSVIRVERDITDITYTFIDTGGSPLFNIIETTVDHNFGVSFDSSTDRDTWHSRLESADIYNTNVRDSLGTHPLFVKNIILRNDGFEMNREPVLTSSDSTVLFDSMFDDGPRDSSYVNLRFEMTTDFAVDTYLTDLMLEDLFGSSFFDQYVDRVSGLGVDVENFLANNFITAVDIDTELTIQDPRPNLILDMTYWLPDSGVDFLLALIGEHILDSSTLVYRLMNGIPPFHSDFTLDEFSITSGQISAPVPEPGSSVLMMCGLLAFTFLMRQKRSIMTHS